MYLYYTELLQRGSWAHSRAVTAKYQSEKSTSQQSPEERPSSSLNLSRKSLKKILSVIMNEISPCSVQRNQGELVYVHVVHGASPCRKIKNQ